MLFRRLLPEPDRSVLARPQVIETLCAAIAIALQQGGAGPWQDIRLVSQDWGFGLHEIDYPLHLWHGERDGVIPVSVGQSQAAVMPNCRTHFVSQAGHYSLPIDHIHEILTALIT